MPQEIKRWKCDHCKKHFASKRYTEQHEKICFFNTENKTCPTCKHFNGCFDVNGAICLFDNRKNKTEKLNIFGKDGFYKLYNVFTEFLIYNCVHWKKWTHEENGGDDS